MCIAHEKNDGWIDALAMPPPPPADDKSDRRFVRLLLIDGDPSLGSRLAAAAPDFAVDRLAPSAADLRAIGALRPELILAGYDVRLAEACALCLAIRESHALARVPFVILARVGRDADEIRAFDSGVSDYVPRIANAEALARRFRNALGLRNASPALPGQDGERVVEVGDLTVRENAYSATVAGERVDLTAGEFRVLWKLAVNAGRMMSHEQLLPAQTDPDRPLTAKTLRFHVASLRRKLGPVAGAYIHTTRNAGYRLSTEA